ncbi:hypothetical protein [Bradyrhizobium sp. 76]|uniref:hypothetical protein n=1 Tax=Bradyrhizobium sp. 76 TaxID=2782680 RepID=UPI001FFA955B|nr:hypothetical protein [Bradyrhizobium sp. 76]
MNSAIAASAGPVLPYADDIGSERTHAKRVVVLLAALVATPPARAGGQPYPVVPPEVGVAPFIGPTWDTYRCAEGPVINFYHGAYYGQEPPALYRGYAYRPHYRYSAYRRLPRKYFCVTD